MLRWSSPLASLRDADPVQAVLLVLVPAGHLLAGLVAARRGPALAGGPVAGEREEHVVQGRAAYRDAGGPDPGLVQGPDQVGSDPVAHGHLGGEPQAADRDRTGGARGD